MSEVNFEYISRELCLRRLPAQVISDMTSMYTFETIKEVLDVRPMLYDIDFIIEIQKKKKNPDRICREKTEKLAHKELIKQVKEKNGIQNLDLSPEEDIDDLPF